MEPIKETRGEGRVLVGEGQEAEDWPVRGCNFSGKPYPADWPPEMPGGVESPRVADMYFQDAKWVDLTHPAPSVHIEIEKNPGPDGSLHCRTVDDTKVTQQLIHIYCVKTFLRVRRKLSWKRVTMGAVVVGAVAMTAPVFFPVHLVAAAVAAGITAGGGSTSVLGGAILTIIRPGEARRDPSSEEVRPYERLEARVRDRPPILGPWRPCHATDKTHQECVQHG
jgi:hypothetical protein